MAPLWPALHGPPCSSPLTAGKTTLLSALAGQMPYSKNITLYVSSRQWARPCSRMPATRPGLAASPTPPCPPRLRCRDA